MALGDGIRRNIAAVSPAERDRFRDAMVALNKRFYPGGRDDSQGPGGVSHWFKQDEVHKATHVHGGAAFIPWHRELCNRLEALMREVDPQLSLHYWDWTQDPRAIPNANLGGGSTGTLNLFTAGFMGYGGPTSAPIGEPWLSAGYYVPGANPHRDGSGNPADPPAVVNRFISGTPISSAEDATTIGSPDFPTMRQRLEISHNKMHGFVAMGGAHISFRDPFVFLLHSNVDRLFARWQRMPGQQWRLNPDQVYGSEGSSTEILENLEPWAGGTGTRPWAPPDNEQVAKNCKHPSVVNPPRYDTDPVVGPQWRYDAIWKPGNDGRPIVWGWTLADLKAKNSELFAKGFRMAHQQSYDIGGGQRRYDAIWVPGGDGRPIVWGWTLADLKAKNSELFAKGFRMAHQQNYDIQP